MDDTKALAYLATLLESMRGHGTVGDLADELEVEANKYERWSMPGRSKAYRKEADALAEVQANLNELIEWVQQLRASHQGNE